MPHVLLESVNSLDLLLSSHLKLMGVLMLLLELEGYTFLCKLKLLLRSEEELISEFPHNLCASRIRARKSISVEFLCF